MPRSKNTKAKSFKSAKSVKIQKGGQDSDSPDPNQPSVVNPDQENAQDVEEIGELINNDIETDEEWEDDEEGGPDDGYDNQYESDADSADDCAYDVARAKRAGLNLDDIDDDDDDDVDDDDFNEPDDNVNYKKIVPTSERISSRMITKYEKVRLICDRTTQLALGAKPMIKGIEQISHSDREKMIAQLEFEARVIPIIIERERPDGAFEEWKLSELKYKEDMIIYGKEAFSDPTALVIDPVYLKKRSKELQTGGNITGYSKVTQAQEFSLGLTRHNIENRSGLTPMEALLGSNIGTLNTNTKVKGNGRAARVKRN